MRLPGPAAVLLGVACGGVLGGLAGCGATENAQAVRADLLATQDELARTRLRLRETRADLVAADREAATLRARLADAGSVPDAPEVARALGRVEGLSISRFLSGGLDRDGVPGDELLAATVAPTDAAGAPVKAAGAVELELLDLTASGDGRTVGSWAFDAGEAADRWRSTPVGTGYRFRVPLPKAGVSGSGPGPGGSRALHLHASFATPDGRVFDATRAVTVRLPDAAPLPAPAPFPVASREIGGDL